MAYRIAYACVHTRKENVMAGRWSRVWDSRSRIVSGLSLATVAVVTGRISYTHICELTLALHQPVMVARLMPFGVDGLIVIGSVILLDSAPVDWWLGWCGVGPGAAVSLFANVMSGVRFGWLAAVWAGVPAAAFTLSTFMFERWLAALSRSSGPDAAEPHWAPDIAPSPPPDRTPDTALPPSPPPDRTPDTVPPAVADTIAAFYRIRADRPDRTQADIATELGITDRTLRRRLAAANGSSHG
jgi:hypothetical protein